ncbi:unnamed protein product [Paramecium sonneborni]|uniref:Uncharacterized protein n=1 Tax=Paramecium sonneborni TaxID=65129 RepID=A0A8S1P5E1_9CILI|nr:unnamed protein product [Paramecium sonneborni]
MVRIRCISQMNKRNLECNYFIIIKQSQLQSNPYILFIKIHQVSKYCVGNNEFFFSFLKKCLNSKCKAFRNTVIEQYQKKLLQSMLKNKSNDDEMFTFIKILHLQKK